MHATAVQAKKLTRLRSHHKLSTCNIRDAVALCGLLYRAKCRFSKLTNSTPCKTPHKKLSNLWQAHCRNRLANQPFSCALNIAFCYFYVQRKRTDSVGKVVVELSLPQIRVPKIQKIQIALVHLVLRSTTSLPDNMPTTTTTTQRSSDHNGGFLQFFVE